MSETFTRRKLISRLLVMIYLLIGSGFGNALIWCQEGEAFSHLEYNMAGRCENICLFPAGSIEANGQTVARSSLRSIETNCLDTQLSLLHAHSPQAGKLAADSAAPAWPAGHGFSLGNFPVAGLPRLNPAPQPPPSQALMALHTIVLLN